MKFTKEHQAILDLSDADIEALRADGALGVVIYESSQMVLDQWTVCYTIWRTPRGLQMVMDGISVAVTEGRSRRPMALEF